MSGNLQPKGMFELALRSFITYMENKARQLMKLYPSPEAVTETARVCRELKHFFHGTRLPTSMTNQLTKHLLIKLNCIDTECCQQIWLNLLIDSSIGIECCQQMLLSLVEVFMHPDVTAIELGQSYFHEFGDIPYRFITWMILAKIHNLHNLKVLNVPIETPFCSKKDRPTLVFPSQLKELTVHWSVSYFGEDIVRAIVESCPELESLTICERDLSDEIIPLILRCKNLKTLRLPKSLSYDFFVTLINGLSTDATSDVLSASTLKSFYSKVGDQNTLSLIVDKLPHLTEIELVCKGNIDLSNLTQLKNLRSLSLSAMSWQSTDECKKILPVLGKNLVFLEINCDYILDLEFIAETCTQLKCFHFYDIYRYKKVNFSSKTFQNFKTVECLKVGFKVDENYLAAFLIAQCTNIKTLTIDMRFVKDTLENPLYRTIEDVLTRTPALNWISMQYRVYDEFIQSLPSRHPNFRIVKTDNWMRLSSQAEVFDYLGCYI